MLCGVGHAGSLSPCPGRETNLYVKQGEIAMLYTIAVVLLIAWLLGIVGTYTIGAFVHVLLVIAIVLFLVGVVTGRRRLSGPFQNYAGIRPPMHPAPRRCSSVTYSRYAPSSRLRLAERVAVTGGPRCVT